MSDQWEEDHAAPLRDRMFEPSGERIERIVGIGHVRLLQWWRRFRHYRHPHTYGQTACESATAVAWELTNDDPQPIDRWSAYDLDVKRAAKLLRKQ